MPGIKGSQIRDDSVESVDIKDGTIKNADVNSGADIAQSKINSVTGWISDSLGSLKGSVDAYSDLPATGNSDNDIRFVNNREEFYQWDSSASEWNAVSFSGNVVNTIREDYVVSSGPGQTTFTLSHDYVPGTDNLRVYKNGLLMKNGAGYDYTETDEHTVTFEYTVVAGDDVSFIIGNPNNNFYGEVESFTATASQTVFNTTFSFTHGNQEVDVFKNGLLMLEGSGNDYQETADGQIAFNNGLVNGDIVVIRKARDYTASGSSGTSSKTYTAGESIGAYKVCAKNSTIDQAVAADKRYSSKIEVIGISTAAASSSHNVTVQGSGLLDGFTGLTAGDPVFLGDSGAIIQDTDLISSDEYRVWLGVAKSTTEIDINVGEATKNDYSSFITQNITDGDTTHAPSADAVYDLIIIGAITMYGAATAPTGWLLCNGAAVSRTTYAALFAVIGTTYGTGDGSTTFNVPDMRGAFPRGVGTSTKFTQNHTTVLGTAEDDSFQGHWHELKSDRATFIIGDPGTTDGDAYSYTEVSGTFEHIEARNIITDGANGTPRTSNETRPNNVGVNFIIKY